MSLDFFYNSVKLPLDQPLKGCPFWEMLPYQSVGVFVQTRPHE
jgi:hypothetical protein